ncbi:hypothetical protein IFM89_038373 [Coptis chinensis]|uniref:Protein kinase domain-containing protein n=1 Tax=Coptis chinensis TaxID=261450 RepID=A0A835H1C2_9MAGN|nr:hypothetical protein IFM89_038373 [Coptis chinensis]
MTVVEAGCADLFSHLFAGFVDASRGSPGGGLKRKIECVDDGPKIGVQKKIEEDFVLGREIGRGGYGSVRLCTSKVNGVEFACKTLRNVDKRVRREIEIMQYLSGHPGIVTLNAVYEDADCLHLVMELCSGGDLFEKVVKKGWCSESKSALILKRVDIRKLKLADFGLATWWIPTGNHLSGLVGSRSYVAPEVLLGDYSEKVDIWSAGVLLHYLLVGALPFEASSMEELREAHKKKKLNLNSGMWVTISRPARDLVRRMLTWDVSSRLTADEVLSHPWFMFHKEQSLKPTWNMTKKRKVLEDLSNQLASPKFQVMIR